MPLSLGFLHLSLVGGDLRRVGVGRGLLGCFEFGGAGCVASIDLLKPSLYTRVQVGVSAT